ncbi:Alpha/Beta hydrolase protein [Crepidotus variabilis]|uniref:triacylglycerol lipase n=1 Tax=Crepidotus variabilis TaxID=179855 RepID=A0A9P6EEV2_9AGAR|nr:Alpha/Beta hydrolase protein [Crepidotus variabilis]
MLLGLPVTLQSLISTFLWNTAPDKPQTAAITFQLRHHHGISNNSRILFSDFQRDTSFLGYDSEFIIQTSRGSVARPKTLEAFTGSRRSRIMGLAPVVAWDDWEVPIPDVTKRSTLYQLAKMAGNSYFPDLNSSGWYDVSEGWKSNPHGWLPEDDGLRGHIFVSNDNTSVVISIKGTSATWPVGEGGPTAPRDKLNDNMLFSCCCGRVGPTWSPVCGCYSGGYKCDENCIDEALKDDGLFYPLGLNLYNNVSYLYPNANIWITGHSLGGGLASLMGTTFGAPVVAFEAPAERRAWQRLHLPIPPSTKHITHVYNTADPIPQGTCTGIASICAIGGFALETKCHIGQVILYDTVSKLGWSVDARSHPIKVVIDRLLSENADWKPEFNSESEDGKEARRQHGWGWIPWPGKKHEDDPKEEPGTLREVPRARPAVEVEGEDGVCTDCFNWEYGSFQNLSVAVRPTGCGMASGGL